MLCCGNNREGRLTTMRIRTRADYASGPRVVRGRARFQYTMFDVLFAAAVIAAGLAAVAWQFFK